APPSRSTALAGAFERLLRRGVRVTTRAYDLRGAAELLSYLSSYVDQELDEDLTEAAQIHLATCDNFQVVLNTRQSTILLGRGQGQRLTPAQRRNLLFPRLQDAFQRRPLPGADDPLRPA